MKQYLTFLIDNAQIHGLCVQINPAVKFVLFGVKFHIRPPFALRYDLGGINKYQGAPPDRYSAVLHSGR
jgi:hypothetical protein